MPGPRSRRGRSSSARRPARSPGSSTTTSNPAGSCKECIAEGVRTKRKAPHPGPRCATHHRAKRNTTRDARKGAYVEKTYNITEDQYQALLAFQGGCCAICRRIKGLRKRLAVDHDHSCCDGPTSCGKCVRGLLCTTCNKFLGHIRDSPAAMEFGKNYLIDPPANHVLGNQRGTKYVVRG